MIMEHFEVHKEQLEDLIVDLDKYGPSVVIDIPPEKKVQNHITTDELALLDELSGLTPFIDTVLTQKNIPVSMRSRIESRIFRYSGERPKVIAMNELRENLYGRR